MKLVHEEYVESFSHRSGILKVRLITPTGIFGTCSCTFERHRPVPFHAPPSVSVFGVDGEDLQPFAADRVTHTANTDSSDALYKQRTHRDLYCGLPTGQFRLDSLHKR